jgi:hypothetical protein
MRGHEAGDTPVDLLKPPPESMRSPRITGRMTGTRCFREEPHSPHDWAIEDGPERDLFHCPGSGPGDFVTSEPKGGYSAYELAEVDHDHRPAGPRTFDLVRYHDMSGVSGEGIVAQGAQMRDGAIALRWCVPGKPSTWNLFDSIEDVVTLNGHNGLTVVRFHDGGD